MYETMNKTMNMGFLDHVVASEPSPFWSILANFEPEVSRKKLQCDRFQNFCSRIWASELLAIFCAGPSPALVCQSQGLALIPRVRRNLAEKEASTSVRARVRHIDR